MNMTAEKRATAFVRMLRVGDKFQDADGKWEVTKEPKVRYYKGNPTSVTISIRRYPNVLRYGRKPVSRRYIYDVDHRVKIVH